MLVHFVICYLHWPDDNVTCVIWRTSDVNRTGIFKVLACTNPMCKVEILSYFHGIMFKLSATLTPSLLNLVLGEDAVIEKPLKMNDNNNGDAGKFIHRFYVQFKMLVS